MLRIVRFPPIYSTEIINEKAEAERAQTMWNHF